MHGRLSFFALVVTLLAVLGCGGSAEDGSAPALDSVGVRPSGLTFYEVRLPSTVANGTYRPTSEIRALVLDAMRAELAARPWIDVDEGRDPTTTAAALRLAASVPSLVYASGNLSATVQLGVFRHSSGVLLATITKHITMAGVSVVDRAKEDVVISTAASRATEQLIEDIASY